MQVPVRKQSLIFSLRMIPFYLVWLAVRRYYFEEDLAVLSIRFTLKGEYVQQRGGLGARRK